MPRSKGRSPGDELVKVIVEIPKNLSLKQRRLIEEFANEEKA
jgi:DnaJ-class molecular chaperone